MNDDDPSDVVHEKFAEAVLTGHPLGRPIGGTPETISAVPRDAVWEHYQWHYRPETLVVSAAGGVDHDTLVGQVAYALAAGGWDLTPGATPRPRRAVSAVHSPAVAGDDVEVHRPVEQANIIVGTTGLTALDDRRFTFSVLSAVFGGGMSSRLFQEVREKRGLAYSTYCFGQAHTDAGLFGMYAGCTPANLDTVEALLHSELDRLANDGITAEELDRSIGQLCGGMVLGLEDSSSRMSRLGRAEVINGELYSLDEVLDRTRAVTRADVQALAADLAARPRTTVKVGPFGEK
jgi:predicted Zn-dependent peptidase